MSQYGAIVGPGLNFAGVDQGIDFTGAGEVRTPAAAVVTRVMPNGSGWPGEGAVVNLKLVDGPAAGHYLYFAEDLLPTVRPGQRVPAGAVIGHATGSGKAPGIEIGWAQPSGIPLAPRPPARPASQVTASGSAFNDFIQAVSSGDPAKVSAFMGGFVDPHANDNGQMFPKVVTAPVDAAKTTVDSVVSVGKFLGRLTDASYLLRGLQILGGAGLVGTGLVLLARQVALAADLPDPVKVATRSSSRSSSSSSSSSG